MSTLRRFFSLHEKEHGDNVAPGKTSLLSNLDTLLKSLSTDTHRSFDIDIIDLNSDYYHSEVQICQTLCESEREDSLERRRLEEKMKEAYDIEKTIKLAEEQDKIKLQLQQVKVAQQQWVHTSNILANALVSAKLDLETFQKTRHRILINLWDLHLRRNSFNVREGERKMTMAYMKSMEVRSIILTDSKTDIDESTAASKPRLPASETSKLQASNVGRKDRPGQSEFASNLREVYQFSRGSGRNGDIWCCVTKDWIPYSHSVAAHIVPYSLEKLSADVFGRNENLMDSDLTDKLQDKSDLKAHILDRELRKKSYGNGKYFWKDVHEAELQFPNGVDCRPGRRYLYFHMLLTVIRRSIYQPPNWAHDLESLMNGQIWATGGQYLEEGVISNIVRIIGNKDVENQIVKAVPMASVHITYGDEMTPEEAAEGSAELMGWLMEHNYLDYEFRA